MAFYDTTWYANSVGYAAITAWATGASIAAGALRRQLAAPAVNNERVFVAIVGGTTHATTEPTWTLTRGAKTTDNTVTWQECTGCSAVNGDLTNTPSWIGVTGGIATAITLGAIIKRNNAASYWICSTAGNTGTTEPAWANNTAGTTQTDSTVTWTCLGVVGNFTGGQAPHARILNATTTNWFSAGNTVYIGDNHAESQTAAISFGPSSANPLVGRFICHNHSGAYPPASGDITTGASISTTANNNITYTGGSAYFYGITFKVAVGVSTSSAFILLQANSGTYNCFDNCSFWLSDTQAGNTSYIGVGANGLSAVTIFNNCTVKFAVATNFVAPVFGTFIWQNTGPVLASGSVVPTSLIYFGQAVASHTSTTVLEAIDLSQLTGNIYVTLNQPVGSLLIKDCKLNAAAAFPQPIVPGLTVQFVRCDSAATGYKSARYQYEGVETTDTTVTRVGGASDPTGQAQSRKIVTTANSQWLRPFKAEPYAIWNPTTAANVTVTVYGTINAGALPNNDDIWLEVEYLGSSASPLGTIVTTTKSSVLAANAAVASDSSTWNYTVPNTTLNPADKEAHISLSGGNLTATGTAGWTGSVRAVDGQSSGKYYWECTFNASAVNSGVGVSISTLPIATVFSGAGTGQAGVTQQGGVYVDGGLTFTVGGVAGSSITFGTITSGTVICVAIDVPNKLLWWRLGAAGNWNNNASRNPATGAGGVSIPNISTAAYPSISFGGADTIIANFGSSAFTGAVPSGFTSGFPAAFTLTPFKLTTTLSAPQPGMAGYLHARVRAAKPSATYYIDPKVVLS
jgi:hypothetical protein